MQTGLSRRALVVEDDEAIRSLVSQVLEEDGFAVISTDSGAGALRELATEAVDIVVTDWNLPHINGEHVIAAARELLRGTPILIITGDPSAADRFLDPPDLLIHVLPKPFTIAQFLAAVANALGETREAS